MRGLKLASLLGVAHFAADCSAGLLVVSQVLNSQYYIAVFYILLYNLLAFGAMAPIGLVIDRYLETARIPVTAGLFLLGVGLFLGEFLPILSIILSGTGSALFHAGGGALALQATPGESKGPGLFLAPGVVGLGLGGWLAYSGDIGIWPVVPLALGLCCYLAIPLNATEPIERKKPASGFTESVWPGVVLFMVAIIIRSGLWNVTQLEYGTDYSFLFWLAVAAGLGKALGGVAADISSKTGFIILVIPSGALLLALSAGNSCLILPGVALLQSASPAMFTILSGFIPGEPATVSGLALGLAIVIGSISNFEGIGNWLSIPDGIMLTALLAVLPVALVGQSRSNVSKLKRGGNI